MSLLHALSYVALGVGVGTLGTLIGAGGRFALLPALVFLHPREPAADLAAISLVVVCANSMSGSFAYARQGRIDRRAAVLFSLAGLPGSILGAWLTHLLDRRRFDPLLGLTLVLSAVVVFARRDAPAPVAPERETRTLVGRDGSIHR